MRRLRLPALVLLAALGTVAGADDRAAGAWPGPENFGFRFKGLWTFRHRNVGLLESVRNQRVKESSDDQ